MRSNSHVGEMAARSGGPGRCFFPPSTRQADAALLISVILEEPVLDFSRLRRI
jgi:hypothetical protein